MQINIAFASLFQVTDTTVARVKIITPAGNKQTAYRGTCVLPFFPNRSTFADLYSGIEYRLNKYAQVHEPFTQSAGQEVQDASGTPNGIHSSQRTKRSIPTPPFLDPLFACHCPHCGGTPPMEEGQRAEKHVDSWVGLAGGDIAEEGLGRNDVVHESDVNLTLEEYAASSVIVGTVSAYPVVSVIAVTRRMALSSDLPDEPFLKQQWQNAMKRGDKDLILAPYDDDDIVSIPRDAHSTLPDEVMHLNIFLDCLVVESPAACDRSQRVGDYDGAHHRPIITENGMTHRSPSMATDHCPLFINDPQPVEVSIRVAASKPPLRFRFAQFHTVRDLMLRLERTCGGRVSRIVDTDTGAGILPCEFLGHVVWKLRSRMAVEWFPFPQLVPTTASLDANRGRGRFLDVEHTQPLPSIVESDDSIFCDLGENVSIAGQQHHHVQIRKRRREVDDGDSYDDDASSFSTWSEEDDAASTMKSSLNDRIEFMDDAISALDREDGRETLVGRGSTSSTYRLVAHSAHRKQPRYRHSSRAITRHGVQTLDEEGSIRLSLAQSEEFSGRSVGGDAEDPWLHDFVEGGEVDISNHDAGQPWWMTTDAPMKRRGGVESYDPSSTTDEIDHIGDVLPTQPIEYARAHLLGSSSDEDEEPYDDEDIE